MKVNFHIRHTIALIAAVFFYLVSNAQTPLWDTLPWKQYADYKLQNLNKSYVTTGVLYDRVFPIANVDEYTGQQATTNTDTVSAGYFMQAYYEMYNATYNTQNMLPPEVIDSTIDASQYAVHPIGVMLYKFNSLDTNALQDHLIDTLANGQFIDVANRSRSPYKTNTAFVASPLLAEGEVMEAGEQTFSIDPSFFFTNDPNFTITQVKVDFGDGQGYWVVDNPALGGAKRPTGGGGVWGYIKKTILGTTWIGRIIIVRQDLYGAYAESGNPFKITIASTEPKFQLTNCKGLKNQWVIETPQARLDVVNNQYGNPVLKYETTVVKDCIPGLPIKCKYKVPVKDTAYFFFSDDGSDCGNRVVKRPVIFIDGFDPTNSRDVGAIYKNYINKPVERNGDPKTFFGDYMLSKQYDFIILDFKHGNDLLERNALTLVSLIERLNATYGSNYLQDITLIGPSMGSLIAQYALAYMEKNNIPHHVKTYISFDGCHQGANVPIGLQNYIEYFTRKGIFKKNELIRNGLYNGLAARQMLAHHTSANSQSVAPDALRIKFLQNLAAVGEYPQLCRKVAIINGVSSGLINKDHPTANHSLLRIYTQRRGWKSLWGGCMDKICMKLDWECYTTPNTSTAKVTDMWTVEPLFNILFWAPLGRKLTYASAAWNNSSQDNAPGGTFGTLFGNNANDIDQTKFKFLLKEFMYLLTGSKRTGFTQNINQFTMMPSYSSADLRFPTMTDNSAKNLYMKWDDQYLCGHTPFDYVYAPTAVNEQHVSISAASSFWFENEISCNVVDLPTYVAPQITGEGVICTTSKTYSISTCKTLPINKISWSINPPNLVTFSSTSGTSTTLTKAGNGVGTLTATVSFCNNTTTVVSKNITVGAGVSNFMIDNILFNPNNANGTISLTFKGTVTNVPTATSYKWYLNNVLKLTTATNVGYPLTVASCGTTYPLKVEAITPCGTLTTIDPIFKRNCNGNNGNRMAQRGISQIFNQLNVYPNPVKDILKIQVPDNYINKAAVIYNENGVVVKRSLLSKRNEIINVTKLPSGTYIIKVQQADGEKIIKFVKQ